MATTIKKIITHSGAFHADEVSAIACFKYIKEVANIEIERRPYVSKTELENPDILVIDIGDRYEPELNNFDHHHNPQLPASNILVLNHFWKDCELTDLIKELLFNFISDIDCGKNLDDGSVPTISTIIRNFNNYGDGFYRAVKLMEEIIGAYVCTAINIMHSREEWQLCKFDGHIAISESLRYIIDWKKMAKEKDIRYLIQPSERGGIKVETVCSSDYPIPTHPSQTFLHNSNFMAVYTSLEDAVAHISTL